MKLRSVSSQQMALVLLLAVGMIVAGSNAAAQNYTPATNAFEPSGSSFVCNASDLTDDHDLDRGNPEWKPIDIDPNRPVPNNPTRILEGFVQLPPPTEDQN